MAEIYKRACDIQPGDVWRENIGGRYGRMLKMVGTAGGSSFEIIKLNAEDMATGAVETLELKRDNRRTIIVER